MTQQSEPAPVDSAPVDYSDRLRSALQRVNLPSFRALGRAAGVSLWQVEQLRQGQAIAMRVGVLLQVSQVLQLSLTDLLTQFSDVPVSPPPVSPPQKSDWSNADGSSFNQNEPDQTEPDQTEPDQCERAEAIDTETGVLSRSALSFTSEPSNPEPEASDRSIATPAPLPATGTETHLRQLQHEYQRLQAQLAQQHQTLIQTFQQASLQVLEPWLLQFPTAAHAVQQTAEIPATRLLPLMRPIDQLLKSWGVESIAAIGKEVDYDPQAHQLMEGTAQPGDRVRVRYAGYRQGDRLLYRAKVSPIKNQSGHV